MDWRFVAASDMATRVTLRLSPTENRAGGRKRSPFAVNLPRGSTVAEALQANARAALARIAANAALLRTTPGEEATHQLRVDARRLRSLLDAFAKVARDRDVDHLSAELRWLAKAADRARNLDVYRKSALEPAIRAVPADLGLHALRRSVAAAREIAGRDLRLAVSSIRYRALERGAREWMETGLWLTKPAASARAKPFARAALTRRLHKLLHKRKEFPDLDDAGRHRFRVRTKKLRYAAEGLSPLFAERPVRRFMSRLTRLQEALGELNDIASMPEIRAGLSSSPEAACAADELAAARQAEKAGLLERGERRFRKLAKTRPFWD